MPMYINGRKLKPMKFMEFEDDEPEDNVEEGTDDSYISPVQDEVNPLPPQ